VPTTPSFEAIDLGYQGLVGAANSFLLQTREGPVLIEAGPQACVPALERGLKARGVEPASIRHCFVTHIHLDHAGAAGAIAALGATVHVHPFGAPHLVDPSKLIASSRRVHGESYERWYGDPIPIPHERVHAVSNGEGVIVGELRFQAIETPGHARHHHAWCVRREGSESLLFTGDAAATFVPGSRFIGIPTPPPEYDLDAWRQSIGRIREVGASRLVLTHGGAVDDPESHLRDMRTRLEEEDAWLRRELAESDDDDAVLSRYRPWLHAKANAAGVPPESREVFIGDLWMGMNIMGVRRAMSKPRR